MRQAIVANKVVYGEDHEEVAASMKHYAKWLYNQKRNPEASAVKKEAKAMLKRLDKEVNERIRQSIQSSVEESSLISAASADEDQE